MKSVILNEVCKNVTSGGTPNTRKPEYYGGVIPWLKTQEVDFNRIYYTDTFITEDGLKNSSAKWIPENSVIVAMYGATAGRIAINKIPLTTNQACCNLIIDNEKADYRFIYYNLLSRFDSIANMAVGGAQQNLNAGMIKELPIDLPDIPTQKAIAEILSSLDDKIEMNNQINQNLEALAQAIFKQWFVDFEFPNENGEPYKSSGGVMVDSELGGIPKGWSFTKLGYVGKVITGKTPSKKNPHHFGSSIPFVTPSDFKSYFKLITSSERGLSNDGGIAFSKNILPVNSVIVTCIGSDMGKVAVNRVPCVTNQQINSIIFNYNSTITSEFSYYFLKSIYSELKNMATGGSTMPIINKTEFENIKIISPRPDLVSAYSFLIRTLDEKIEANIRENTNLVKLRDTLLPKLISGELKVNQVEKEVYG